MDSNQYETSSPYDDKIAPEEKTDTESAAKKVMLFAGFILIFIGVFLLSQIAYTAYTEFNNFGDSQLSKYVEGLASVDGTSLNGVFQFETDEDPNAKTIRYDIHFSEEVMHICIIFSVLLFLLIIANIVRIIVTTGVQLVMASLLKHYKPENGGCIFPIFMFVLITILLANALS